MLSASSCCHHHHHHSELNAPPPTAFARLQDALAQPLGGNISAEQRQELEKRAQAMREVAARLQRVSAVRGDHPSGSSGPRLDPIFSGKVQEPDV